MYVTKLCVRMPYVKRCKKIVCERVVREKWFVNITKLCVARAWAKLRVRDTRIISNNGKTRVWIQTRAEPPGIPA